MTVASLCQFDDDFQTACSSSSLRNAVRGDRAMKLSRSNSIAVNVMSRPSASTCRDAASMTSPGNVSTVVTSPDGGHLDQAASAERHLARRERLHDVVVGAELEAAHPVLLVTAGGQDDHRRRVVGPDRGEHVESAGIGERQVEDHEIRRVALELREGTVGVGRIRDAEPVGLEPPREEPAYLGIIVHDQDSHRDVQRSSGPPGEAPFLLSGC